jgi:uncharacterized protein
MPAENPTGLPVAGPPQEPAGGGEWSVTAAVAEPAPAFGPTQPDERIALIDVLRGLALFGIIVANMRGFAGPLAAYVRPDLFWKSRLDFWVQAFVDTFIQGKFITIFAFLFGVGFVLQFTRAEKRHGRFVRVYIRRLLALLLFGILHQLLFWWGDILATYALGGFLLIRFRKRRSKTILVWALALMFLPLAGVSGFTLYRHFRPRSPQEMEQSRKKAAQKREKKEAGMWKSVPVYQSGGYLEISRERLQELKHESRLQPLALLTTFPLFLLGLWVWRRGILQDPESHRALLRKALITGALIGIPANMAFAWAQPVVQAQWEAGSPTPFMVLGGLLATVGRPALSMCYGCAVALLFLNASWRRRMMPFAAVGRTALSNYILQTVVGTTIFYGYGGALFGKLGLAWLLVLGILIYALEAPLSNWWLGRYRFGPLEWVWRWMTYGRAPLLKRAQAG